MSGPSFEADVAIERARAQDSGWDGARHQAARRAVERRFAERQARRRRVQVASAFACMTLLGLALRAVGDERPASFGDASVAFTASGDAGLRGDGPVVD